MVIRSSRSPARHSFSPPPSSATYRNIAFTFLALTVVVVIGALWVSSVHARVSVKVKRNSTQVESSVEIAKSPEQGQLRGRVVQGVFEKIQEFSAKEQQEVPMDAIVQGKVRVSNNYSKPQTLVKTTRLLTSDGKLYRINRTIVVGVNESVVVDAYSDQPGKRYVIPVGTKFTIPGLWVDLQKWITAEAMSGFSGSEQITKIVTAGDVKEAQKVLEDAVFEQARNTLRAEAGITDEWEAIYIKKMVETKSNVSPGQMSDQFLASVKLDVTAVYYPKKDMEALIRLRFKEKLPEGYELTDFNPSLVVYKIQRADAKTERSQVSISAQANFQLTNESPQLSRAALVGLSIEEAHARLTAMEGVETVDIRIRPSWIQKLPSSKDRLEILVQ